MTQVMLAGRSHALSSTALRHAIRLPAWLALILCTPAAATAATAKLPGVPANEGGPRYSVRPPVIGYTGDGSGAFGGFDGHGRNDYGHLHWRFWNGRDAAATGANWVDNCKPDCASGHFYAYRARFFAFRPRGGHFTRLTLRDHYHGRNYVLRFDIVGNQYVQQFRR